MEIAIVGGGLSGLALCWYLLQNHGHRVILFDAKGIAAGASGAASGLLHPYAGQQAHRSIWANEALSATKELLHIAEKALGRAVADQSGIIRFPINEEQEVALDERCHEYSDIVRRDQGGFFISSGMTVYPALYMEGLWRACTALGAVLKIQKVSALHELDGYDKVFIAAGAGSLSFTECRDLPVKCNKGQILTCQLDAPLEKSLIGRGYVAKSEDENICHVGATYERGYSSEEPDIEAALEGLKGYFPEFSKNVIGCRAGIRVVSRNGYLPIGKQIASGVFILTAMGSRGLLYHALYAKRLVDKAG